MTTADLAPAQRRATRDPQAGGAVTSRSFRIPEAVTLAVRVCIGVSLFAYAATSLIVVVNATGNATGVVWLPSFPDWYYVGTALLYRPVAWWFALLAPIQAWPGVDFTTFAWVSRAPFFAAPIAVFVGTGRQSGRQIGRAHV